MTIRSALLTVPAAAALSLAGFSSAHAVAPGPAPDGAGTERTYDPSTLTPVPNGGGLIAPDGTDVCAEDPESVVGPDGTFLCFTGVVTGPGGPGAGTPEFQQPQVEQLPVGGVDTGVPVAGSSAGGLGLGAAALGAAVAAGWAARRRRAASGS